jgi:ABC-2 type transport system ATP-binding protein
MGRDRHDVALHDLVDLHAPIVAPPGRRGIRETTESVWDNPHDRVMVQAVVVRELEVVRGGRRVLGAISLSVARGLVTGLLGPSGSGKSTLLRSIVGVQCVAGGSVTVLGAPAGAPLLRDRVAYVTQAPSIYADLSVRENLRYFARIVGAPMREVEHVIARVYLEEFADQVVARLSGGQRARVSLATALLGRPELLVLDEPTANLDPAARRDLVEIIRGLEVTTLVITHDLPLAAELCPRCVVLTHGRVAVDGSTEALLANPGLLSAHRLELPYRMVVPRPGAVASEEGDP